VTVTRRLAAEFVGTLFLLAAVVGSGIMGNALSDGNVGLALLANSTATGAALVALIVTFGPLSGAHFNPAVTALEAALGHMPWREVPGYWLAQGLGAVAGVVLAHIMFDLPILSASTHARTGVAQLVSEVVATFGLLVVIWGSVRARPSTTPFVVGAYIAAAYWFTASTSFANPAVTLARAITDTFAGIRPADVAGFVGAQFVGVAVAVPFVRWLGGPER